MIGSKANAARFFWKNNKIPNMSITCKQDKQNSFNCVLKELYSQPTFSYIHNNYSFKIANWFDCVTSLWFSFDLVRAKHQESEWRKKNFTIKKWNECKRVKKNEIHIPWKRTIKCNLKVELLWKGKLAVDEIKNNTQNQQWAQFFCFFFKWLYFSMAFYWF